MHGAGQFKEQCIYTIPPYLHFISIAYMPETQTLWSQINYNFTVFTVNNIYSVQNVVHYKITTALFRTLFEHNK